MGPRQKLADDISKSIFLYENCRIWIHISRNGQPFIWTKNGLIYWRIYASLGLNELVICCLAIIWTNFITIKKSDILQFKLFTEDWVVYPRTSGSPESTCSAECQVGSGVPRGLAYITHPWMNILTFIVAHHFQ